MRSATAATSIALAFAIITLVSGTALPRTLPIKLDLNLPQLEQQSCKRIPVALRTASSTSGDLNKPVIPPMNDAISPDSISRREMAPEAYMCGTLRGGQSTFRMVLPSNEWNIHWEIETFISGGQSRIFDEEFGRILSVRIFSSLLTPHRSVVPFVGDRGSFIAWNAVHARLGPHES